MQLFLLHEADVRIKEHNYYANEQERVKLKANQPKEESEQVKNIKNKAKSSKQLRFIEREADEGMIDEEIIGCNESEQEEEKNMP